MKTRYFLSVTYLPVSVKIQNWQFKKWTVFIRLRLTFSILTYFIKKCLRSAAPRLNIRLSRTHRARISISRQSPCFHDNFHRASQFRDPGQWIRRSMAVEHLFILKTLNNFWLTIKKDRRRRSSDTRPFPSTNFSRWGGNQPATLSFLSHSFVAFIAAAEKYFLTIQRRHGPRNEP